MGIGKNTIIGLATDFAVFALGIVLSVVLTRSLGADQRGVYVLLVITNVVLANVAHFSVGGAFSTMLARERYTLGEINGIAVILAFALGAACTGGVALLYPFLEESIFFNVPYTYILVAAALTSTTIYQIYWNSMMMGLNQLFLLNKLNLAVNLGSTALMTFVVGVLRWGIPGILAVWTLTASATLLAGIVLAHRIEPTRWRLNRASLRDLIGFGLRGHGANIAHHLFLRFDMYAVNAITGTRAVGFYSLSTSLAEKLWLPLNSIQASSKGKIAQLPPGESALLTAKIARTSALMMLLLAVPFALVSPWLIPFMYGDEFQSSVLPLVMLLPGNLGFAVMMVLNNYIIGQMERPGLLSIISWLQLAVSVPLYLGLVVWQGITGAAIASTLTYLLALACTLYVFARDSGLPLRQVLIPRRSDFSDYLRVLKPLLHRVPILRRFAGHPS